MKVRSYKAVRDLQDALSWWKERTDIDVHETLLAGRGFTVEEDGDNLAIGFVYYIPKHKKIAHLIPRYPMAFSGFEISNPNKSLAVQAHAMAMLIEAREKYAKNCGAKFMLSVSDNAGYNRFLKELGYSHGGIAEKLVRAL